ncbi:MULTISPECIES: tubby C-terminal domain-like protein [Bacillus]|uniref:Tubby C-terminal domain-containing protein n=2 Tax=Bacillus TaxID=1386 RepID=A0A0M4FJE9_9BACI|nr:MULTISPECIES: hypothetical protein [Bacillus]ALC83224.1 hypothetical protein AM592_17905 [Bacillus gobiensis]MBP1084222.1 hypothetical protein [Bacillus capparidis]MED1094663.1 hypothetical protein [Bacillus capparidis]
MKLYQYKWRPAYFTNPAEILDENSNCIGTIKKHYSNVFIRLLDVILEGKYFVQYQIHQQNDLIFETKAILNPFKKRQYKINYYGNDKHIEFLLIDKKMFDIVEVTSFDFDGETFHLKKAPFEWGQLTVNDELIAEWHIPLKPPFTCKFKLYNSSYENMVLFLIGIFHTYLTFK